MTLPPKPVVAWALDSGCRADARALVASVRALDAAGIAMVVVPVDGLDAIDPLTVLSAAAVSTRRIGLVAGLSPWQQPPFLTARALATLDALSSGRAGWLVQPDTHVAALSDDSGRWAPSPEDSSELRSEAGGDYLSAAFALWDSWEEDAVVADRSSGQYVDDAKVHVVDHRGPYYASRGPLNMPRSPQGRPLTVVELAPGAPLFAVADVVVLRVESQAAAMSEVARMRAELGGDALVLIAIAPIVDGAGGDGQAAGDTAGEPTPRAALTVTGRAADLPGRIRELLSVSEADGVLVVGVDVGVDVQHGGQLLSTLVPALNPPAEGHASSAQPGTGTLRSRLGLGPVPSAHASAGGVSPSSSIDKEGTRS